MARRPAWTVEQIRALGVATDLTTAANVLGIGRTLAYQLVSSGRFPVPVIRAGSRVIVPVAPLLRVLRADDPDLRLDSGCPPSVDAMTTGPADWPRRTRRADREQGDDDRGGHR